MRWDDVARATAAAVLANPALLAFHGGAVRQAGDIDKYANAMNYRIITDTTVEQWEPCIIQWEIWGTTQSAVRQAERDLRELLEFDEGVIQGVYMISQYEDGSELGQAAIGPSRQELHGRAVRFRHSPIRESLRAGRSL